MTSFLRIFSFFKYLYFDYKIGQQFMKMIELMISTPNWTLRPWKTTLESQLNSWVMRLVPGVSSSTEGKEIAKFKGFLK